MGYERKIAHLEETHSALDRMVLEATETGQPDWIVSSLKKQKLRAKDLIRDLVKIDDAGKEFK